MLPGLAQELVDQRGPGIVAFASCVGKVRVEQHLTPGTLRHHVAVDQLVAPAVRENTLHVLRNQGIPLLQKDEVVLAGIRLRRVCVYIDVPGMQCLQRVHQQEIV
ncbi:hypothetical protein M5D96_011914, partial [Drosophila gunungcola]